MSAQTHKDNRTSSFVHFPKHSLLLEEGRLEQEEPLEASAPAPHMAVQGGRQHCSNVVENTADDDDPLTHHEVVSHFTKNGEPCFESAKVAFSEQGSHPAQLSVELCLCRCCHSTERLHQRGAKLVGRVANNHHTSFPLDSFNIPSTHTASVRSAVVCGSVPGDISMIEELVIADEAGVDGVKLLPAPIQLTILTNWASTGHFLETNVTTINARIKMWKPISVKHLSRCFSHLLCRRKLDEFFVKRKKCFDISFE